MCRLTAMLLLVCLGSSARLCALQEAVARAALEKARSEHAAGHEDEAACELYRAALAAERETDPVLLAALESEVAEAARVIDSRLDDRREMERSQAAMFLPLARELVDDGFPLTARVVLRAGAAFDEATVRDDMARCEALASARDAGDPRVEEDQKQALGFELAALAYTTNKKSEVKLEDHRAFNRFIELRRKATGPPMRLAKAYLGAGMVETAMDVAQPAANAFLEEIRDEYRRIAQERNEVVAERRYERWARPVMEDFKKHHRSIPRGRRWKVTTREITVPPPGAGDALLVSEATVDGDHVIEADVNFSGMVGTAHLVVAFLGPEDFCTLEFERPRGPTYYLRFCHYKNGIRSVVAESDRAPQTLAGWHTLRAERIDGETSARFGDAEIRLVLPVTGAVAYGFFEPGGEAPAEPGEIKQYRNLIVRPTVR